MMCLASPRPHKSKSKSNNDLLIGFRCEPNQPTNQPTNHPCRMSRIRHGKRRSQTTPRSPSRRSRSASRRRWPRSRAAGLSPCRTTPATMATTPRGTGTATSSSFPPFSPFCPPFVPLSPPFSLLFWIISRVFIYCLCHHPRRRAVRCTHALAFCDCAVTVTVTVTVL